MSIPYDLDQVISECPTSANPSDWTPSEAESAELLREIIIRVNFREWGDDEDYDRLAPYFGEGFKYKGK